MAAYDISKRAGQNQLRADRQEELDATTAKTWPRDINDSMRWLHAPTSVFLSPAHNRDIQREYAARMCKAEIAYLDDVEKRISAGDSDLAGWEV